MAKKIFVTLYDEYGGAKIFDTFSTSQKAENHFNQLIRTYVGLSGFEEAQRAGQDGHLVAERRGEKEWYVDSGDVAVWLVESNLDEPQDVHSSKDC